MALAKAEPKRSFEQALLSLTNNLLFTPSSPSFYQGILSKLLKVLEQENCKVSSASLLMKQDQTYRFVASVGFDAITLQDLKVEEHELLRHSQLKLSYKQKANIDKAYLQKLKASRQQRLSGLEGIKLESSLLCPITVGPEVVAVLFLDGAQEKTFHESFRVYVKAICRQLGIVFRHTRLQEHDQRQAKELLLLERVRTAVATELDFGSLMKLAVSAIADVFPSTHVSFYKLTPDAFKFTCDAGLALAAPNCLALTEGLMARVIEEKQPVLIIDVQRSLNYAGDRSSGGIISEIVVPILDRDRIVGILKVESSEGVVLGESEFDLMLAIRKQLHIAISRSQLFSHSVKSEKRFRLLAENTSDVITLHSLDGRFLYVSPSSEKQLGYHPSELMGKKLTDYLHDDDKAELAKAFKLIEDQEFASYSYRFCTKDGAYVWLEASWQLATESNGARHLVSSARNITERKRFELELAFAAQHDSLTGLVNRAMFMEHLERVVSQRSENPSLRAAVLFIDLDRFKITNDSLGHSVGDSLLKGFAKRLRQCVKEEDTVARFAGDEFAILLENLTTHSDAKIIAERIHKILENAFDLEGYEVFSSASIGMAFINATTVTAEDVIRNADVAMYSAKRAGGSSFTVFNASMYQGYIERLNLEADLRVALEEEQLSLAYQPIFDLKSRTLAGFEALLRWNHPELGFITPDKFVPIAEETGLILKVDDWVLAEACRQMVAWQKKFVKADEVFMSVNLSTRHLMLDQAAEDLLQIVRNQGLDTKNLKFEVTEGAVMSNADAGAAVLARFRSEGIKIQIDDFGTGYSSLSYLHKLPLDSLKIDRSFVQRMEGGRQDIEIIRTILSLAKNLNFDVVAEGIETQYQLETLAGMGTTHGQGYFIAKPLQPDIVAARFFADKRNSVFA